MNKNKNKIDNSRTKVYGKIEIKVRRVKKEKGEKITGAVGFFERKKFSTIRTAMIFTGNLTENIRSLPKFTRIARIAISRLYFNAQQGVLIS